MKDVQSLLRQLGQGEELASDDVAKDGGREARMAAHIDAEVVRLVRTRRRWRTLAVSSFAAAALVLVGLGLTRVRVAGKGASIGREPVASAVAPRRASDAFVPKPAASSITPPSAPAPPVHSAVPSSLPSSKAPSPSPSAVTESTLAEENRLFKAAAEASRQGDTNGALTQLDRLLANHPRSPLAQTAQVRKFRLLAKAGSVEAARREAERYLSSYPTGFAVAEAETLARGAVSPAPSREPIAP